jgi:hypothetical protein
MVMTSSATSTFLVLSISVFIRKPRAFDGFREAHGLTSGLEVGQSTREVEYPSMASSLGEVSHRDQSVTVRRSHSART